MGTTAAAGELDQTLFCFACSRTSCCTYIFYDQQHPVVPTATQFTSPVLVKMIFHNFTSGRQKMELFELIFIISSLLRPDLYEMQSPGANWPSSVHGPASLGSDVPEKNKITNQLNGIQGNNDQSSIYFCRRIDCGLCVPIALMGAISFVFYKRHYTSHHCEW